MPILTAWPEDGGPFIILGLNSTILHDYQHNMGLYRLQKHDDYTLGFHVQMHQHHDGAKACHKYGIGECMSSAISFGGDLALIYAAMAPPFILRLCLLAF